MCVHEVPSTYTPRIPGSREEPHPTPQGSPVLSTLTLHLLCASCFTHIIYNLLHIPALNLTLF